VFPSLDPDATMEEAGKKVRMKEKGPETGGVFQTKKKTTTTNGTAKKNKIVVRINRGGGKPWTTRGGQMKKGSQIDGVD